MESIKIEGELLPSFTSYDVGIQDIHEAAGRNAEGTMLFDIVATKRKIDLQFQMLTIEEQKKVLRLLNKPFFNVEYHDPQEGISNGIFYVGDRSSSGLYISNGQMLWKLLKFNLIEA
ncbi:MAG TPA: hypothetical protein DCG60_07650 [Tissierella sp.]|uniref:DUF6711 family protein n=1 Tax=Tissierella praeacuta TaxID=43131 RepID=UPI000ECF5483|nr:DUF6711 family protein [Tissierella praeacuta]HAE92501.1 hypothetical protein [Tissierella sp.]